MRQGRARPTHEHEPGVKGRPLIFTAKAQPRRWAKHREAQTSAWGLTVRVRATVSPTDTAAAAYRHHQLFISQGKLCISGSSPFHILDGFELFQRLLYPCSYSGLSPRTHPAFIQRWTQHSPASFSKPPPLPIG